MAKFCTQCGSPTSENQKFCNKCGAQIDGAELSSVQAGSPPPVSPPAPTAPSAMPAVSSGIQAPGTPAKKGGPIVAIILVVLGFFILISVLGIGSCFYIAYKVKQKAAAIAESARTRGGNIGTPEMSLSDGGPGSHASVTATEDVPPYPGSTPTQSGGELSAGPSGSISAQEYETSDSVEQVESFYKEKLGSKVNFVENDGKAVFNFLSAKGMTTLTLTRDESAGKTKINIARIGK